MPDKWRDKAEKILNNIGSMYDHNSATESFAKALAAAYEQGWHDALAEEDEVLKWCPVRDSEGEHYIEGGRCLLLRCGKPIRPLAKPIPTKSDGEGRVK